MSIAYPAKIFRLSIWLLIPAFLASCQSIPKPDNSTLTLGFAEAVFGLGIEFDNEHAAVNRSKIVRWNTATPVYLSMRGENIFSPLGQSIFKDIESVYSLAGIELVETARENAGTLLFEISENKSLRVDNFNAFCYASITDEVKGVIKSAKIVVTRRAVGSPCVCSGCTGSIFYLQCRRSYRAYANINI